MAIPQRFMQQERMEQVNLPMSLRIDPEKASKVLMDLKRAVTNIRQVHQELNDIRIDGAFESNIKEFWLRLNCYALTGTDCTWTDAEISLQHVFDTMFLCYRTMMKKEKYKVSDIVYAHRVLDTAEETFDAVIEELEQTLMI